MRGANFVFAAIYALAAIGSAGLAHAQTGITAFEGARLIVGDGSAPIENATLLIEGGKILQAGRSADIQVPAGATRVSVAGKTLMPASDRHAHPSQSDARGAHAGFAAARILRRGRGPEHGAGSVRRARHAWPDHSRRGAISERRARDHHARTRAADSAPLDRDRRRGPPERAGTGRAKGGHRQDLGRRPAGQVQEAHPGNLWSDHRRGP